MNTRATCHSTARSAPPCNEVKQASRRPHFLCSLRALCVSTGSCRLCAPEPAGHHKTEFLPSLVQLSIWDFGRRMVAQSSAVASSVRSCIRPAAIRSSASLPGFNRVAPLGLPPKSRLMMIGRATSPYPAIAQSTHLLPVASSALANSATATASPPDVHRLGCACAQGAPISSLW